MENKCEVCGENPAKYRCPGCSWRTCSLVCVNQHKHDTLCDGTRNKTDFVAVKEFTDISLLNDYRFLEDAGRKADNANRGNSEHRGKGNYSRNKLMQQCKNREISLLSMPLSMTRRKQNRSYYHSSANVIFWTVEWTFPQSDSKYTAQVRETAVLREELQRYIDPSESDPIIRHKLKVYIQPGIVNTRLFMKVEGRTANSVRYHELDKDKSLTDNLKGKTLIEHPTIHCVLCYCCHDYQLLQEGEGTDVEAFTSLLTPTEQTHTNHHHGNKRRWHQRNRGRNNGNHGHSNPHSGNHDSGNHDSSAKVQRTE